MNNLLNSGLPAAVANVQQRLDEWRRSRSKLGPIPTPLWKEAAALARTYGLTPVARALRLGYGALKHQMGVCSRVSRTKPVRPPAFVELALVPPSPLPAECTVELERPDGARMKIKLTHCEGLVALAESFWRWCA